MTVYELIQQLAKCPPDLEVQPVQHGSRKRRRILSVNLVTPMSKRYREELEPEVLLRLVNKEPSL